MADKYDLAFANVIKCNVALQLLQKPNGLWVLSSLCGGCLSPWVALSELGTSVLARQGKDPARPLSPSAIDSMDSIRGKRG